MPRTQTSFISSGSFHLVSCSSAATDVPAAWLDPYSLGHRQNALSQLTPSLFDLVGLAVLDLTG
jgi:hypothetical protein